MLVISILGVALLVALGYFAYQYTECLADIARLHASVEDKEAVVAALKGHIKKLEDDVEYFQNLNKAIKSELQSCNDKAKAAKAKAAKASQAAAPIEAKTKRTYNKKSK